MERDIVFFDLESTGVDVDKDRIVQFGAIKRFVDTTKPDEVKNILINPTIPIPKEASDIHGITDEMVEECPTFDRYANKIWEWMRGCDIGGYNQIKFDIPLVVEELLRAGVSPNFKGVKMIDGFVAYRKMTPRTLTAAYKTLIGEELIDAHDAIADIKATVEVIDKISELSKENDVEEDLFAYDEIVDYAGKFARDENGYVIYNFGKNKGEIAKAKDSFLTWMLKGDFTQDTMGWVKNIRNGHIDGIKIIPSK